jgi:hypothetical protein
MLGSAWTLISSLVWILAGLYLIMTISIWWASLRTLGLSSLRHSPRILRLSFRAGPIRELSLVMLTTLIAILVIYANSNEYRVGSAQNALLLIMALCCTLFFVPPVALVFSSSTNRQLRWALTLKGLIRGRRVISLLDTAYMRPEPGLDDVWAVVSRRSLTLTDILRTSDLNNWHAGVRELIEITPIVVVDTRVCTPALLFEASTMLAPQNLYKAIFVIDDDGACPVLQALLDNGGIPSDCKASIVKKGELRQVLQSLITSRDSLPKPGSFPSSPSTIGERAGRSRQRQSKSIPETAANRLSTPLTFFWRLMANVILVQVMISLICGLLILAWPRMIVSSSQEFTLWFLIACNLVFGPIYFYLGRSLKKVYLEGDSLYVSDYSKECKIHLSQICRVTGPDWTTLRRITLHLNEPSVFGKKIVFAGTLLSAGLTARDLQHRLYRQGERERKPNPQE